MMEDRRAKVDGRIQVESRWKTDVERLMGEIALGEDLRKALQEGLALIVRREFSLGEEGGRFPIEYGGIFFFQWFYVDFRIENIFDNQVSLIREVLMILFAQYCLHGWTAVVEGVLAKVWKRALSKGSLIGKPSVTIHVTVSCR
ncbi:MAG: hypothetical protein DRP71_17845 [Verrucomicrobia bacterium]|nr:MAG: hypothetical protein DRP71_17845 [Verrucomicrobiota bacterium]